MRARCGLSGLPSKRYPGKVPLGKYRLGGQSLALDSANGEQAG